LTPPESKLGFFSCLGSLLRRVSNYKGPLDGIPDMDGDNSHPDGWIPFLTFRLKEIFTTPGWWIHVGFTIRIEIER
jgi:hypothetical protein